MGDHGETFAPVFEVRSLDQVQASTAPMFSKVKPFGQNL